MSRIVARIKQRLRERTEEYLRLAAVEHLRGDHPATTAPYRPRGGAFWRHVFVPVYRRVPWQVKRSAMDRLGMTAKGWTPPARTTGEPWRPPPGQPPA
jgi:hypothetical protein